MAEQNIITRWVADFSLRPGPRYCEQGKFSGEEFYDHFLKSWFEEAINSNSSLEVILDGTDGYLTSFIDESFGRLVFDFGLNEVKSRLIVISKLEPEWLNRLENKTFPAWSERRKKGDAPKHTKS